MVESFDALLPGCQDKPLNPAAVEALQREAQSDGSLGEKAKAFLRAMNVSESEASQLLQGAAAMERPKPCTLEGWWYESGEEADAEKAVLLRTLAGVAKASGNAAAQEGEWAAALEHYYTSLELTWQVSRQSDEELGTIHANCSLACFKQKQFDEALDHASSAVTRRPSWSKAHARRAVVLEAMDRRMAEARDAWLAAEKVAANAAERQECAAAAARVEELIPRFEDITVAEEAEEEADDEPHPSVPFEREPPWEVPMYTANYE